MRTPQHIWFVEGRLARHDEFVRADDADDVLCVAMGDNVKVGHRSHWVVAAYLGEDQARLHADEANRFVTWWLGMIDRDEMDYGPPMPNPFDPQKPLGESEYHEGTPAYAVVRGCLAVHLDQYLEREHDAGHDAPGGT